MYNRSPRYHIDPILNYDQAVEREAQVKPIRGKTIKPLGKRSKTYAQIYKTAEGEVRCKLYNTDVVTFRPNGDIVVQMEGWASQSTTEFLSEVTGEPFHIFGSSVWCVAKTSEGQERKHFPLHSYTENIFRRYGNGELVIQNPVVLVQHLINRKGKAAVLKRYAEFRSYLLATCKLRMDARGKVAVSPEEVHEMFKDSPIQPSQAIRISDHFRVNEAAMLHFKKLITKQGQEDKTRDFYEAFLLVALASGAYQIGNDLLGIKPFEVYFEDAVLYLHKDEAFLNRECFGQMARDRYARFFG